MALTNKQKMFIVEYTKDFNATQAAKRAGYSERTSYSSGQRLLKVVEIKQAIEDRISELVMGPEEVVIRLGKIARGEHNKADTKDELKALELTGKVHAIFSDRKIISGDKDEPLEIKINYSADNKS